MATWFGSSLTFSFECSVSLLLHLYEDGVPWLWQQLPLLPSLRAQWCYATYHIIIKRVCVWAIESKIVTGIDVTPVLDQVVDSLPFSSQTFLQVSYIVIKRGWCQDTFCRGLAVVNNDYCIQASLQCAVLLSKFSPVQFQFLELYAFLCLGEIPPVAAIFFLKATLPI